MPGKSQCGSDSRLAVRRPRSAQGFCGLGWFGYRGIVVVLVFLGLASVSGACGALKRALRNAGKHNLGSPKT